MSFGPVRFSTFVLIGGGPSLTDADVEFVHGTQTTVIVINEAVRVAPWADILYAADRKWIDWHDGVPGFNGYKYSIQSHDTTTRPGWIIMNNTGFDGLETASMGLRTGYNGGYQAIGLAYHLGAKRIILLGFDMKDATDGRTHWHAPHRDGLRTPYAECLAAFETIVQPLAHAGVEVINCTRRTALTAFPCAPLTEVLRERAA